jgi:trimeric autotransporter adhesin
MADGVSSEGVSASAGDSELQAIYRGGDNFMARIKAMETRTETLNQAITNLRIGNDAVAALADARNKQQQVEARQRQVEAALAAAARRLSEANAQATSIVAQAKSEATGLRRDAETYATQTKAEANAVKAEADGVKAHAEGLKTDAQAKLAEAETTRAQAQDAVNKAAAAERAHLDAKDAYEARVGVIHQAHREFIAKVGATG